MNARQELDRAIIKLWNEGHSVPALSKMLGCSSGVSQALIEKTRAEGVIPVRDPITSKSMPRAKNVPGPRPGFTCMEMPANGCRHYLGGEGEGLTMCGQPSISPSPYRCHAHHMAGTFRRAG